jgi:hypothetical protein
MERITKFLSSLGGVLTSLAAIVGGVVALYLAFGGGDNSSSTPPTSNATLERWQSDAESICNVADKQVIGFPTPVVGDPAASDAWVTWLQKVIPIVKTSTNQLRALDAPAEAQADIDRLLDTMDKLTDSGDKMLRASRAFNFELMDTASVELLGATDDMQRQMAELGLTDCLAFS